MTRVYTRQRRTVWALPWWLAVFALPFYLLGLVLWLMLAMLWLCFVLPWRAVIWLCGRLRFPHGVDTDGEGSQVSPTL